MERRKWLDVDITKAIKTDNYSVEIISEFSRRALEFMYTGDSYKHYKDKLDESFLELESEIKEYLGIEFYTKNII